MPEVGFDPSRVNHESSHESFPSSNFTSKSQPGARDLPDPDAFEAEDDAGLDSERAHLHPRSLSPMSASEHGSSPIYATDPWDRLEETKSTNYLLLLTTAMLGLQIAWSVEIASVSPFLLSLGMSKSLLALVWIAGPLSGTLVQPYIGIRSDNCRLRWGRRRPFMVGGTIVTIFCLLSLSWTREIVSAFVGIFGVVFEPDTDDHPTFQIFAVALIYLLDFAINVIQASLRAFLVDSVPTHQQDVANAWASRVSGAGHVLAYAVGFLYLPGLLPWLGDTQFKVFVALACIVMAITMTITCVSIQERDPRMLGVPSDRGAGVLPFFRAIYRSMRKLPPQVRKVCIVQICAWIGWFPFLFYTSTYIGGLYAESYFKEDPYLSDQEIEEIWERGTRAGTFALFMFAIVTLMSSILLPMIIPPTYQRANGSTAPTLLRRERSNGTLHSKASQRPVVRLQDLMDPAKLQIRSLTLRRAWLMSHLAFAVLMFLTFFVTTPAAATVLIALIGVPWALTNWAPFALIAAEISRRDANRRGHGRHRRPSHPAPPPLSPGPSAVYSHPGVGSGADLRDFEDPLDNGERALEADADDDDDASADQAGVLLGIHNVAIAAPQVIATIVSSIIFHALQKPRGNPGDDSTGWVMRFGGVCALAAAWACRNVEENAQHGKM